MFGSPTASNQPVEVPTLNVIIFGDRAFMEVSEVTQSCLTLGDPLDCSLPDSSLNEIFQARVLEWVAISFSRGFSQPRIEPGSLSL